MSQENENVAGAKNVITQKKIDNLFKMIQTYKRPSLVAKMLGVDVRTYTGWIEKGNEVLSQHPNFTMELTDSILDALVYTQEYIEDNREQLQKTFLEKTHQTEINIKNAGRFDEYLDEVAKQTLEETTNNIENEMIDKYEFSENDSKNEKLKKYVKVARISSRSELAMKSQYIANVDKHCSTGKNVGLSMKMLEITDDEFRPTPTKVDVSHNGVISFIDMVSFKSDQKTEGQ